MRGQLLVVAGEASGDRAAAAVVSRLGVPSFGIGGPALEASGTELLADLRGFTAMGLSELAGRAARIARAFARVAHAGRRARAALLVGYTEFNARLAPRLHRHGVRVLWYGAPQVWAWRRGRARSLRRHIDRMAVVLPFEEALWREEGVDAHYVGHPARDTTALDRDTARRALGLTPRAAAVAILPGSRPHEVRRMLEPMLDAYLRVRDDRASVDGRVLLAPSLDAATHAWALATAADRRVPVTEVDPHTGAAAVLAAFDVALSASGTASLEAALARAVPVVAYRVDLATQLLARALLKVEHVALPNVLLGRPAFPELLQRQVRADTLADAMGKALDDRPKLLAACDQVEAILGEPKSASREVARLLAPWL